MNNPTVAGVGANAILALDGFMGTDYVRELAKAEPILMRDQRQMLDWLAHGKIAILLSPKTDTLVEFITAAAPVITVTPTEGTWLTAGSGSISLLTKAPHLNASRVFINWFLGKQGQTMFVQAALHQSTRLDVPTDHLVPAQIRTSGVKYFPTDKEEVILKRTVTDKLAKEVFGPLVK